MASWDAEGPETDIGVGPTPSVSPNIRPNLPGLSSITVGELTTFIVIPRVVRLQETRTGTRPVHGTLSRSKGTLPHPAA